MPPTPAAAPASLPRRRRTNHDTRRRRRARREGEPRRSGDSRDIQQERAHWPWPHPSPGGSMSHAMTMSFPEVALNDDGGVPKAPMQWQSMSMSMSFADPSKDAPSISDSLGLTIPTAASAPSPLNQQSGVPPAASGPDSPAPTPSPVEASNGRLQLILIIVIVACVVACLGALLFLQVRVWRKQARKRRRREQRSESDESGSSKKSKEKTTSADEDPESGPRGPFQKEEVWQTSESKVPQFLPVLVEASDESDGEGDGAAKSVLRISNLDITSDAAKDKGHDATDSNREASDEDGSGALDSATSTVDSLDEVKAEIASLVDDITSSGNADELEVLLFHLRALKSRLADEADHSPPAAAMVSDTSESDPSGHPSDPSDPSTRSSDVAEAGIDGEAEEGDDTEGKDAMGTTVASEQTEFIGMVGEVSEAHRTVLTVLMGHPENATGSPASSKPDDTPEGTERTETDQWRQEVQNDIRAGIEKMCAVHQQMLEQHAMQSAPPGTKDEYYAAIARAAVQRANAETKRNELEAKRAELELVRLELELKVEEEALDQQRRGAVNDGGDGDENATANVADARQSDGTKVDPASPQVVRRSWPFG